MPQPRDQESPVYASLVYLAGDASGEQALRPLRDAGFHQSIDVKGNARLTSPDGGLQVDYFPNGLAHGLWGIFAVPDRYTPATWTVSFTHGTPPEVVAAVTTALTRTPNSGRVGSSPGSRTSCAAGRCRLATPRGRLGDPLHLPRRGGNRQLRHHARPSSGSRIRALAHHRSPRPRPQLRMARSLHHRDPGSPGGRHHSPPRRPGAGPSSRCRVLHAEATVTEAAAHSLAPANAPRASAALSRSSAATPSREGPPQTSSTPTQATSQWPTTRSHPRR